MRFRLTHASIDTASSRGELLDGGAGGYASFEGWVRDHNEGRAVERRKVPVGAHILPQNAAVRLRQRAVLPAQGRHALEDEPFGFGDGDHRNLLN